jgi:hypothetical protein
VKEMNFIGLQDSREDLPLIVVDLGYSRNQKSCGIASPVMNRPIELQFGQAIKTTAELISRTGSSVLALEAVLSTFHQDNGNPDIRGDFEKGRGWYHGPGVATLAAALRFLTELRKTAHNSMDIYLAEAYLSFKKSRSRHMNDAQTICDQFWQTQIQSLAIGTEPVADFISGVPSVRAFKTK